MSTACGRALAIRQTNIVTASTETAPRASSANCLTLQRLGTRSSTLGTAQQRDDLVCSPKESRAGAGWVVPRPLRAPPAAQGANPEVRDAPRPGSAG